MIVGTNSYRWLQYFQARGERLEDHLDEALAATARAGLDAWEQAMLPDDAIATRLGRLLDEIFTGQRPLRVFRQMKMYNDPTMNPYLYNAAKQAARPAA